MAKLSLNRRGIFRKEAQELLKDARWEKDVEYSKLSHGDVYLHPDGRVLVLFSYSHARALIYPTRADYEI
ncbi:MAG: hypothetical protein U0703_22360 [Anaerolineae bacterium]